MISLGIHNNVRSKCVKRRTISCVRIEILINEQWSDGRGFSIQRKNEGKQKETHCRVESDYPRDLFPAHVQFVNSVLKYKGRLSSMFRAKKSDTSKKSLKTIANYKKQQLADFLNLPQEFQTKESMKCIFQLYLTSLTDVQLVEAEAIGSSVLLFQLCFSNC
jgi:hypothetical protein